MRYVRYVGLAHSRQITAADWRSVGISADTVVWDAFNGFAVPLDQLTDDQVRKAIDNDAGFVITGENDDDEDEFVPDLTANRPMTPQELESPRVDILDPDAGTNASTPGSEASSGPSTGSTSVTTGRGAGHDES
jgi:hypothetical protein